MQFKYPILIPRTTNYNVISEASLKSSPKNILKHYPVFKKFSTNLLTILFRRLAELNFISVCMSFTDSKLRTMVLKTKKHSLFP